MNRGAKDQVLVFLFVLYMAMFTAFSVKVDITNTGTITSITLFGMGAAYLIAVCTYVAYRLVREYMKFIEQENGNKN